ncbi:hypothetical protein CYLTODRAFT_489489 [Cylindrobasidium torrendii FP15055 ss-10]|uniref:Uncharacterized protein n=1 Tax=Cylindrobasidium torrendii FP15055 ss-10 TaxID=1314674 RepID=A0A0D7BE69_9AGAR|nr:hypothetical protein CYLTODRAFT_489489 [Cylindrobasidium torrendii FP15055 ss-10]
MPSLHTRSMMVGLVQRDSAPRIAGSLGGFIALVVCLCLIIVAACIAIFFLLRTRDPTDSERARRRHANEQAHRYPKAKETMASKLSRIFSSNKPSPVLRTAEKTHQGWVRASQRDEWDTASFDEGSQHLTVGDNTQQLYSPAYPSRLYAAPPPTDPHQDADLKMPSFASPQPSEHYSQGSYGSAPYQSPFASPPRVATPDASTTLNDKGPSARNEAPQGHDRK